MRRLGSDQLGFGYTSPQHRSTSELELVKQQEKNTRCEMREAINNKKKIADPLTKV
jgi:hypothetical protein